MFITLEGPEGAGKSTLARSLAARLGACGYSVLSTYEPGGTPLGQRVRALLLETAPTPSPGAIPQAADQPGARQAVDFRSMIVAPTARAETLLFCAARAQLVERVIRPQLEAGGVVICDRYVDSTLAYQVGGRGLPGPAVEAVLAFATGGLWPDLTVLLDLEVRVGLARKRQEALADGFEAEELSFHESVRRAYQALAAAQPARWLRVDATRPAAEIAELVWHEVARRLVDTERQSRGGEVDDARDGRRPQ